MARYFLIEIGNFFKRLDFYALIGTFLALLGIVLPLIPSNNLLAFFSFNNERELLSYIGKFLAMFLGGVIFSQVLGILMIYWGRNMKINAEVVEYLQNHSNP